MSEANRGPTLLVKVMLGGDRDVGVSQCAAGSIVSGSALFPGNVRGCIRLLKTFL
jgi:hypothetical protein